MTERNIKSNQEVIILYQLNYDKIWWFHGLTDSCWLVSGSCWFVLDSCWFVLTCVWLVLTRVGLVLIPVDSCWLVLNCVYLCWYSCIRIDLINILRLFDVSPNFPPPQLKSLVIISNKHGIYEFPHELPNDLWLRKLGT